MSLGGSWGLRTLNGHAKICTMQRSHKGEELRTGGWTLPDADYLEICLDWSNELSPFFSMKEISEMHPVEKPDVDPVLLPEQELDSIILKRPFLSEVDDVSEIVDWHESQWKKLSGSSCDDEV